jgi:hypothetical protein
MVQRLLLCASLLTWFAKKEEADEPSCDKQHYNSDHHPGDELSGVSFATPPLLGRRVRGIARLSTAARFRL